VTRSISRRDLIKFLGAGVAASSMSPAAEAEGAEHAHAPVEPEKAARSGYQPKFFSAHQYKTLQALCDAILPKDNQSGGAVEAGAPEFLDLLTSENTEYHIGSSAEQRKQVLDAIAYRKNAVTDPRLSQGVAFFSLLRNLTASGFFTSKIGIEYLGYVGNTYLAEFPGCPDVPKT
jgi:gluconate 2-dehydrogenase gamma chain